MWQRDTLMQLKPGLYSFLGVCGFLVIPPKQENQQQNTPAVYYWGRSVNGQKKLIAAEEFTPLILDVCALCARTETVTGDFTFVAMSAEEGMSVSTQLLSTATTPTTTDR